MKKILMVLAPNNFRDEEFLEPKEVFEKNGFQVRVASKGTAEASGSLGAKVGVDVDLSQAKADNYDALVFVGGGGSAVYFNDPVALNLAKAADEQGKILGAICIAPSTLANANLLAGKKATAWSSEQKNLENKGVVYTGQEVEVDGRIVTAKGPAAAEEFGKKIVELLKS